MPLIRSTDYTSLNQAFKRFDKKLSMCLSGSNSETSRYFTSSRSFFGEIDDLGCFSMFRSAPSGEPSDTREYFSFDAGQRRAIRQLGQGRADLKTLKEAILCAFELTNEGETNKINKQQLYAFLFIMGLPTGFIAKTILDGNVGGVRNGILKHKEYIGYFFGLLQNSNTNTTVHGFFSYPAWYNQSAVTNRVDSNYGCTFFYFAVMSYRVGGMNLFKKFTRFSDQRELITAMQLDGVISGLTVMNKVILGNNNANMVIRNNVINLFEDTFEAQRGVRRTGQTLSRSRRASDVVQLERATVLPTTSTTVPNSQARSSVSNEQTRPISSGSTRRMVRDEPLQETIGVEFEVVRPKDIPYNEFVNGIVRQFRDSGLDIQAEGYNHNTRNYWKLVPDASISTQEGDGTRYSGSAGIECVSPVLSGKRGIVDIKKAIRSLRNAGASVNNSVGYHAHFGIGGLSIEHLRNLLYNFRGFEPIIDRIMIPTRRRTISDPQERYREENLNRGKSSYSQWAKSLQNSYPNDNEFWQLLESCQNFQQIQERVFRNDRYWKTNMMAYGRYGTIEFRQHGGSLEEDTVIYWLYWLHYLIQVSKRKKLSFFDYKQVRNITPVWLSTWLGNRAFDMYGSNFNAV